MMNVYKIETQNYSAYVLANDIESAINSFLDMLGKYGIYVVRDDIECVEKMANEFVREENSRESSHSKQLLIICKNDVINWLERRGYDVSGK